MKRENQRTIVFAMIGSRIDLPYLKQRTLKGSANHFKQELSSLRLQDSTRPNFSKEDLTNSNNSINIVIQQHVQSTLSFHAINTSGQKLFTLCSFYTGLLGVRHISLSPTIKSEESV